MGRAGFGWFWVVSGGFGWFRVIPFFSNNAVVDIQSLSDDEFEDFTTNNGQQDHSNEDTGPFFYHSINK